MPHLRHRLWLNWQSDEHELAEGRPNVTRQPKGVKQTHLNARDARNRIFRSQDGSAHMNRPQAIVNLI